MNINQKYDEFSTIQELLAAYSQLIQTAQFDKATIAPKKGHSLASKRIALISGEYFLIITSPKYQSLVEDLAKNKEKLSDEKRRIIELTYKEIERLKNIPHDEYVDYVQLCGESEIAWQKARDKNNYAIFEPFLIKMIEYQRKFTTYRNPEAIPYNLLLDDFQEGMDISKYDVFFDLIKTELVPFIKKIAKIQAKRKSTIIEKGDFKVELQEKFVTDLAKYLDFDKSWGYLTTSVHPFASSFNNNDVRITTAYDSKILTSATFSVIHEIGHATYEHQIKSRYEGTPIKTDLSLAMHESQSRLFENNIGRSYMFWQSNYPKLQKVMSPRLDKLTLEEFYRAINTARPSLIRTEADELTYPIHILIRYEIEKGIFDGTVDISRIDKIWAEKYVEHLGVNPPDDLSGILQDIHWSDGTFGYFPTYALGSAYAAQIANRLFEELDVETILAGKNTKALNRWLKTHLHQYGALHRPEKLLEMATGEPFNPSHYIKYLKEKYSKLYEL